MATPIPSNAATFTLEALLSATRGAEPGDAPARVLGVSTDTRQLKEGALFVALRGERFDGHDHLRAAADAGAVLALVERELENPPLPVIRVGSTLDALGALGAAHVARWRSASGGRVLAITGSAGKTTTKSVMGALAERMTDGVLVSAGNLNNRVGVPMSALTLTDAHRFAIFEIGTNMPGEIAALTAIVRPDVGVVTLIDAAHTEGLGGVEAVAVEKTSLFAGLTADGVAIGNADDARVVAGLERARARRRMTYGTAEDATYRIRARRLVAPDAQQLVLATPHGELTLSSPLLGIAGALACAGAVAGVEALCAAELDADAVSASLSAASEQLSDRMAPRRLPSGAWLVDDSYNANPASCRASVAAAKELADLLDKRLVLVLGEMRELGEISETQHRELGELASSQGSLCIFVGGDAVHGHRAAEGSLFAEDADAAAAMALERVTPNDVVLVKGSRGVRTEKVVAALAVSRDGGAG